MAPEIQIFGTRKCRVTQKAERFFKERGISVQFVDLAEKGLSSGELESISRSAASIEDLLDTEGKEYGRLNLRYQEYDTREMLLAHPLLLKTPIVRKGRISYTGDKPEQWTELAASGKGE